MLLGFAICRPGTRGLNILGLEPFVVCIQGTQQLPILFLSILHKCLSRSSKLLVHGNIHIFPPCKQQRT